MTPGKSSGKSRKLLAVAVVWLVLLGAAAAAYKFVLAPWLEKDVVERTSTTDVPEGATLVRLALDSFSGYAIFRSAEFRDELRAERIALELEDDGADYGERLEALRRGKTQLALFTIDALVKTCAEAGGLPATIVMLVDETRGADAMVAPKRSVPDVDALNSARARIVVTPDSPSETLARVVIAHFQLPELDRKACFVPADGAEAVFERLREDTRGNGRPTGDAGGGPTAYVLWEPYVTRAVEETDAHVLVDSSSFKGYIVDVLVCERQFLIDHEDTIESFVKAYLRASYQWRQKPNGMARLVEEDARNLGDVISSAQAERLVQGVWWKNTQENYAHLGLLPAAERRGLQDIEDMIRKITRVLTKTGAIDRDPTGGQPNQLYYNAIFERLRGSDFFPGLLANVAGGAGAETIRRESVLPELREDQWTSLEPIGTLEVDTLVFARGTSRLTRRSQTTLRGLVETLRDWPLYYLEIRGHARSDGDPEANRKLAGDRARAAADFLIAEGVPKSRLRAMSTEPSAATGGAQTVSFVLGQVPY